MRPIQCVSGKYSLMFLENDEKGIVVVMFNTPLKSIFTHGLHYVLTELTILKINCN